MLELLPKVMFPKGDGPSSALVNRPKAGVPASNDNATISLEFAKILAVVLLIM